MADTSGGLPPKLDLRRSGVLKAPDAVPNVPAAPVVAVPVIPVPVVSAPADPVVFQLPVPPMAQPAPVQVPVAISAPQPVAAPLPMPVIPRPVAVLPANPQPGGSPTRQTVRLGAVSGPGNPGMTGPRPQIPVVKADAIQGLAMLSGAQPVPVKPVIPSLTSFQPPPGLPLKPAPKKETSKIPLEQAVEPSQVAGAALIPLAAPKTIRIKPGSSPLAPKLVSPSAPTVAARSPLVVTGSSADAAAEKRKTSRISLDSVLAADGKDASGESKGPKTIKLKRPSEAVTVKVAKEDPSSVEMEPSKTSKLDEALAEDDSSQSTGKKTIKLKRQAVSDAGAGRAASAYAAAQQQQAVFVDSAHWVFWSFAIISMILVMVTIYMFCAQVFGPDFCLTKYSYSPTGPDLGWFGKLHRAL